MCVIITCIGIRRSLKGALTSEFSYKTDDYTQYLHLDGQYQLDKEYILSLEKLPEAISKN